MTDSKGINGVVNGGNSLSSVSITTSFIDSAYRERGVEGGCSSRSCSSSASLSDVRPGFLSGEWYLARLNGEGRFSTFDFEADFLFESFGDGKEEDFVGVWLFAEGNSRF